VKGTPLHFSRHANSQMRIVHLPPTKSDETFDTATDAMTLFLTRIKTVRYVFILAALCATPALAADIHYLDGHKLLKACETDTPVCKHYTLGIIDGLSAQIKRAFCLKPATEDKELRDTIISFLEAHPDYLRYPAAYQVVAALEEKFPCN
jgi:hypothetical protein